MRFFSIVLFAFFFNFSSCVFSKLKEANKKVATLTEQKKYAESKVAEQDSLSKVNTVLSTKIDQPVDSLEVKGDTMASLGQLRDQKAKLIARNRELTDTIAQYQNALKEIFAIEGNKAERVIFKDQSFDCYVAKTNNGQIQFFLRDEDENKPYLSLNNLKTDLSKKGKQLVFASNAGMYMGNNEPQGLFIQNGLELAPIDKKKDGYGNFYLQPNGVFFIDTAGLARVFTTKNYLQEKQITVKYATQSGPLLVIEGIINAKFTEGSSNKNIRNGVGIIDSNLVVFVISNKPVNFFDFASLFKEHFKCQNALYLDGAISRTYLPELARLELDGNFGPMIGILK